jgi:hypothetical protein
VLSAIAQQFSANRTAANFNALASNEPLVAARFLSRAIDAGGLEPPWKAQLNQILSVAFDARQRDAALKAFFAANQPAIQAMEMAEVQGARVETLGFTTRASEPVQLTGVIGVTPEGQAPTLTTSEGTWLLDTANRPDKGLGNQSTYFEVNVLQSFAGRVGTIRAYPTAIPGTLAVEEFSPSSNPDFISGRLSSVDGRVGFNVRPDKWVEIRDPATAAAMLPLAKPQGTGWAGTGVILPGAVARQDAQGWYLDGPVTDYWMLARSNGPGQMLAAHGQSYPVQGGATPWPEDTSVRLLVFGHGNADGSVSVSGYLKTPNVRVENGTDPNLQGSALMQLTPVDVDPPAGAVDQFTP